MIYPGRMIESDVVLLRTNERSVISKNISYEDSDHLHWPNPEAHPQMYPRQ